jgi:hypothetical protein
MSIFKVSVLLIAGAVAGWLGWSIVAAERSESVAFSDPETALAWKANSSRALLRTARQLLDQAKSPAEISAAENEAQASFRADPLFADALMMLSDIAAREGDRPRSEELLLLAARRSFRNVIAQANMIDWLVAKGDYAKAIEKADVLMRVSPTETANVLMDFLVSASVNLKSYPALLDYLAKRPAWRERLFSALIAQTNSAAPGLRLLRGLAARGEPPQPGDLSATLQYLVAQGQLDRAHKEWLQFLPEEKRAKMEYLFDGDFTEPPTRLPFEWMIGSTAGASVDLIGSEEVPEGKKALRVEFSGLKVPYLSVAQTLHLPGGPYSLTAEAMTEDLRAARGVVWRVSCMSGKALVLGETEPLAGSRPWRQVGVTFEVPAGQCDFQELQLVVRANSPIEQVAAGMVSFRRLRLQPATQP